MKHFSVNRNISEGRYKLKEIFSGLSEVEPLKKCVGNSGLMERILEQTDVVLTPESHYMYINDEDGSLIVGLNYLKTADLRYLYLDVIHELVHVKQYLEGRNLFDETYSYVDRPTELEAYRCAVEEARKIGMSDDALADYIYVEWITKKEFARLLKTLGVEPKHKKTLQTDPN